MSTGRISLGQQGERAAANYMKNKGYKIIERNWRGRYGELDLICERKELLVFVEVKTRTQAPMNDPGYGMTPKKIQHFMHAVEEYLTKSESWDRPCRLDFIGLVKSETGDFSLCHEQNVCEPSEQRNGWQPW